MIHTDNFHCIGKSHQFCQDYSSSTDSGVIISDGCSTAKNSEIGAMLLTKIAEQYLTRLIDYEEISKLVIHTANFYRTTLNISIDSLSATLLTVNIRDNNFVATITGDGLIAAKHKDRGLEFIDIKYSSGAPFYARYLLENSLQRYVKEFPGNYIETLFNLDKVISKKESSVEHELYTKVFYYPLDEYDFIAVLSDGINSFNQPAEVILKEIFNLKSYQGPFIKRRCQKAFELFRKNNWFNSDDFSIGIIVNETNN